MMYEYLKRRGMNSMNEHEFMNKFRHFMNKYRRDSASRYDEDYFMPTEDDFYMKRHGSTGEFMDDMFGLRGEKYFDRFGNANMKDSNMGRIRRYMRDSMDNEGHFNESEARHLVSEMYHIEMVESIAERSLIYLKLRKYVKDIGGYFLHLSQLMMYM